MSMQRAQGVLLFLVRFNNSARFEITELHALPLAARSFALLRLHVGRA